VPSWSPQDAGGGGSAPNSGGGGGGTTGSGAGRSPAGAAARGAGPRGGGIALDFRRKKTAKEILEIDWTHPVWQPETDGRGGDGETAAVQVRRALPIEQAYAFVADGDRRPLLVLRECERCKGTDHALLSMALDNEQTVLLTHWFRCVKLPPNILEEDHPLTKLFERKQESDRIPHLFFADPSGENRTALPGDQSQSQLWDTMFDYLDRCYEGDAKKSLKELRKLLDRRRN
jgi:hypothetical protein